MQKEEYSQIQDTHSFDEENENTASISQDQPEGKRVCSCTERRLRSTSVLDDVSDKLQFLLRHDHCCPSSRSPHYLSAILQPWQEQEWQGSEFHHSRHLSSQHWCLPSDWFALWHFGKKAYSFCEHDGISSEFDFDAKCWFSLAWVAALEVWSGCQLLCDLSESSACGLCSW